MAVLSKLLKYDLRANLKIFLFIWPAILVFGLLERVALMAELPVKISAIFVNLTTVLFVLAVPPACLRSSSPSSASIPACCVMKAT